MFGGQIQVAEEGVRDLSGRKIVVTGGRGFLGRQVCNKLLGLGYKKVFVPTRAEYDLTKEASVERLYSDLRPDVVIHLAARVGGIGANRENPGLFFYENLIMG